MVVIALAALGQACRGIFVSSLSRGREPPKLRIQRIGSAQRVGTVGVETAPGSFQNRVGPEWMSGPFLRNERRNSGGSAPRVPTGLMFSLVERP
jgi:hypothetical protein